jgi:hypothetical protein
VSDLSDAVLVDLALLELGAIQVREAALPLDDLCASRSVSAKRAEIQAGAPCRTRRAV